jgi:MFS family permease
MWKVPLKGNIRVLAVQTLISQLGFGMFYVVWQPYILSTGVTVAKLGLIQSIINLVTAVGLISWGVLSDRFGRKPVILASNACRIVAMASLLISGKIEFLLVFAFFTGFSCLFMQENPARNALISESVGSKVRATAFSTLASISRITNIVVSSAGGYIAFTVGYHPIFILSIVGDVIGLLLMFFYLKETRVDVRIEKKDTSTPLLKLSRYLAPEKELLRFYVIAIVLGIGYATTFSVFFGMLVDAHGITVLQLGFMRTIYNVVAAVVLIPLGRLSDRFGKKPMLMVGWVTGMITVLGFLISRRFELFVIFFAVNALDSSIWGSAWVPLLSETVRQENLSTVMGKLDSYSRLAGILAPWLGGVLYSTYGFGAPLLVHLLALLIYGFILLTFKEKQGRHTQTPATNII